MKMIFELESMGDGHLDGVRTAKHRIKWLPKDTLPVYSATFPAGPKAWEIQKNEIAKMLQLEVIKLAQTNWASPILFAMKMEGLLQYGVDDRKLNAVTVHDSYPVSRLEECPQSLGDVIVFLTSEANSGYW